MTYPITVAVGTAIGAGLGAATVFASGSLQKLYECCCARSTKKPIHVCDEFAIPAGVFSLFGAFFGFIGGNAVHSIAEGGRCLKEVSPDCNWGTFALSSIVSVGLIYKIIQNSASKIECCKRRSSDRA